MKTLLIILTILGAHSMTFASSKQFSEKVVCTVTSINGNLESFLPPRVGDEVTLDASQNLLTDLQFSDNTMIPILVPLQRKTHPDTSPYMVSFQAPQSESTYHKSSLTVMLGKFHGDNGNDIRAASIQLVTLEKTSGLITADEARLSCRPSK